MVRDTVLDIVFDEVLVLVGEFVVVGVAVPTATAVPERVKSPNLR
jgi:hypothetical protein